MSKKEHSRNLKSFEINTVQYYITLDRGINTIVIRKEERLKNNYLDIKIFK
jgi:hypothetical protein